MPPRRGTDSEKWDRAASAFGVEDGDDLLPMWVADMDFFCAPEILEAVRGAYDCGALGYRYLPERVREAVTGWMRKRHALAVSADAVLPIPGVVAGISSSIAAFTEAGDGVIVQPPIYPPFVHVPREMGRTVLENPLIEREENGVLRYEIDFDGLTELARRPDAKLMILCSPHNPTGRVFTPEELGRICRICEENGVWLISDEIHSDIMLNGAVFTPILAVSGGMANVCQLGSPSKSFNTAGTHSAYMIVPDAAARDKLRAFWSALHLPTESFVTAEVICTAYGAASYYPDELCGYITENMRILTGILQSEVPGIRLCRPDATYLLWADLRGCGIAPADVTPLLCREARIIPDPGDWFGDAYAGYIRLNAAMPRALLREAAHRMAEVLRK